MKEVHYYEAEDGTKFESEYDCEKYEEAREFRTVFEALKCYDCYFDKITGEGDVKEVMGDIRYILVGDTAEEVEAYNKLDDMLSHYYFPHISHAKNSLVYFDENVDCWLVWHDQMKMLRDLAEKFQLFEGE